MRTLIINLNYSRNSDQNLWCALILEQIVEQFLREVNLSTELLNIKRQIWWGIYQIFFMREYLSTENLKFQLTTDLIGNWVPDQVVDLHRIFFAKNYLRTWNVAIQFKKLIFILILIFLNQTVDFSIIFKEIITLQKTWRANLRIVVYDIKSLLFIPTKITFSSINAPQLNSSTLFQLVY